MAVAPNHGCLWDFFRTEHGFPVFADTSKDSVKLDTDATAAAECASAAGNMEVEELEQSMITVEEREILATLNKYYDNGCAGFYTYVHRFRGVPENLFS